MAQEGIPWREVTVSAAKGTAVSMVIVGGGLAAAMADDPMLPWMLLGSAAGIYAFCFVLVAALEWYAEWKFARSGPPPHVIPGAHVARFALVTLGLAGLVALASLLQCVSEAVR